MAQRYSVDIIAKVLGNRAVDKLEKSLGKTADTSKRLDRALSNLNGGFAALKVAVAGLALGAVARGFTSIAGSIVQTAGDLAKLNASFLSLTGSTQGVEELRNTLFQLSKTTPFKNDEILESARRFLAVGVALEDVEGTINRVGALAAESGQDLGRLGLIYSQVFAKGRLQGEENLQLLEAGIDLTDELAEVTGKSGAALRDAMSKGQVSLSDFNKALVLATGDMRVLDEAAKSVSVAFENIGDNVGQLGTAFSASVAPAFAAVFNVINDAFDRLFPSLQSVQERFDPILEQAERFAKIIEDNPELVNAIASAFDSLLNFFLNPAVEAAENLNDQLDKDPQGIIEVVQEIELLIRRAVLGAVNLAKVLEGTRRLAAGGLVRGEFENIKDLIGSGVAGLSGLGDLKPFEIKQFDKPEGGTRKGGLTDRTDSSGSGSGAAAAAKAEQKAAEQRERRLAASQQMLVISQSELQLAQAMTQYERINIENGIARLKIEEKYNKLLNEDIDAQTRLNLEAAKTNELMKADAQSLSKVVKLREGVLGPLQDETDLLQAKLNGTEDEYKIRKQIADLVEKGGGAVDEAEIEAQVRKNAALEKEVEIREKLKAQVDALKEATFQRIGQAIEDSIVAGIESAIDGTKRLDESLQEIASNLLKDLGRLFIRAGVSSIAGPGGFGLPGFAEGGIASPGSPALVGEKGPEIITPMSPTLVTPFDATREAVAQSATGIAAEDAFSENAAVLGATAATFADRAAAAKQAEMIASPGGMMNIETTVINSVEYATVDQVQQASAAAAKNARARVFSDLKNKPGARSGIGL